MTAPGPYIVTHSWPTCEDCGGGGKWRAGDEISTCDTCDGSGQRILYREAFATLEEAQDCVAGPVAERMGATPQEAMNLADAVVSLAGPGTITLPDGSVEVESRDWRGPQGLTPHVYRKASKEQILAAWNVEHGIGLEVRI